jgi:hypothetical protein
LVSRALSPSEVSCMAVGHKSFDTANISSSSLLLSSHDLQERMPRRAAASAPQCPGQAVEPRDRAIVVPGSAAQQQMCGDVRACRPGD